MIAYLILFMPVPIAIFISVCVGWQRGGIAGCAFMGVLGAVLGAIYAVGFLDMFQLIDQQHPGRAAFATVGMMLYAYGAVAIGLIVACAMAIAHDKANRARR